MRNRYRRKLARRRRTSVCQSSVLNLGPANPRVLAGPYPAAVAGMPRRRPARSYVPSHAQVLAVIMKCFPLDSRTLCGDGDFATSFREAIATGKVIGERELCSTPVRWIAHALAGSYGKNETTAEEVLMESTAGVEVPHCRLTQLRSLSEVFPRNGSRSKYLTSIILMDVVLNRSVTPGAALASMARATGAAEAVRADSVNPDSVNPDAVIMATAYVPHDLDDENDYKYRTLVAFLPGAGVFYCSREYRRASEGIARSLIPLDMSWLRMTTGFGPCGATFGSGGYVKKFFSSTPMELPTSGGVSAWRLSYNRCSAPGVDMWRHTYLTTQCADHDGPRMPPDIIGGAFPAPLSLEDCRREYNRQLASAPSARLGGRHYAAGCLYYNIPGSCWVIDPEVSPFVDLIVDIAPIGSCSHRKSVIMVRSVLERENYSRLGHLSNTNLRDALNDVTFHNSRLRSAVPVGTARSVAGDVGTMHAIGTRVLLDRVGVCPFVVNSRVSQPVLKRLVESLAKVGVHCFPDVLSVVQNMEGDTGLLPIPPMEGNGNGLRVGYSIDMSVDLGNASHVDSGDASQGFSLWTAVRPRWASNWFLVLPNLYGKRPDGSDYEGVAIKLHHGTAISWDGRVVRHCTSVSCPDGKGTLPVGRRRGTTENHLYGTFTAAKEKIIGAGRALAAGNANALSAVALDHVSHHHDMVTNADMIVNDAEETDSLDVSEIDDHVDGYFIPRKWQRY